MSLSEIELVEDVTRTLIETVNYFAAEKSFTESDRPSQNITNKVKMPYKNILFQNGSRILVKTIIILSDKIAIK